MKRFYSTFALACFAALMSCGFATTASAQVIFRDDFDGTGNVDPSVWRLPFEGEGTFVGRTQFRGDPATDLPQQGVAEATSSDNAVAEIHLNTFSPIDPGNQFLGTDLLTKRNFARGGGVSIESRMRLKPTTTGGLVNGFFLFDVTRQVPEGSGTEVRDEIDWELISNQAVGAATQDPASNFWNDGDFSDGGALQFHDVPGVDLTQFNDYRIDWTPQSVKWFVNDTLVRTQTTNVPDDPMKLHFNIWAPDSGFVDAFNGALTPAAVEGSDQQFTAQVDHVEVSRFNTTVSDNLLTDGSFEGSGPTFIGGVPATTTDTWLGFGGNPSNLNVSYQADDIAGSDPQVPDVAPDGIFMAKMFGPFSGGPDATGLVQNIAAEPGQEFEASVLVQTPSGDSIAGSENFNTIALSFLDSSGNTIQEAVGGPDFVDANGNEFPLLDGRDPNVVEDVFVEGTVSAIAPAGTAFVRVSLFFIQLNNEGGASWFDDARLVLLTPDELPGLAGDFNSDGVVDATDYAVFRDNLGLDDSVLNGNGDGSGTVDAGDLAIWRDNYGATAAAAAAAGVPEPAALTLVLLSLLGLSTRRR